MVSPTMKTVEKFICIFFEVFLYLYSCASTYTTFLCTANSNEFVHSMSKFSMVANEGSLSPKLGYQIKLSEQINQFNFCN